MTTEANSGRGSSGRAAFRVLFVCTGNTCRSPIAEGVLKKLLSEHPDSVRDIEVLSAGTMGLVGHPATELAIAVSENYGVDIREHRSRALTARLLADANLVFAMAAEHLATCRNLGKSDNQVFLLKAFPNPPRNLRQESIDDPIGGDRSRYEKAYFEIDEAIRRALPGILQRTGITS